MSVFRYLSWLGLLLCMTVLPYVVGNAALRILYAKWAIKFHMPDRMLTGWILCIGAAEAVHLAAIFLGLSVSSGVKLLAVVYAVLLVAAAVVLWRGNGAAYRSETRRQNERAMAYTTLQTILFLTFALLVIYQVITVAFSNMVYRNGDLTAETVESFLRTDMFYQVNPMTGSAYEQGIPFRLKILCLPTLYAFFCKLFGLEAVEVVWKIVPVVTLLGSYLAFYLLAGCFFPKKEDREKRQLFMLFVAVVFCVGDYMYGMDGFGLLYSGFRGVTIRNMILLPYTLGAVLRRNWKLAVLCVLGEVCIVWTLYGMGACLLVAVLLVAVQKLTMGVPLWKKTQGEPDRKKAGEDAGGDA